MVLGDGGAPVEILHAGRNIQRGVPVEEVDGLQADLEDLAWHDGEVLDARHVVDAELDPDHNVLVLDLVFAVRPAPHAGPASRLVGVPAAGVQLAVPVARHVDVVVGELGAFEVEAVRVRQHLLERRRVDLVPDGLAVDGVFLLRVHDLERAVGIDVEIQAAALLHHRLCHAIAHAVRVPFLVHRHRVRLVVHEPVAPPVEHGVDAQREDVLMVHRQHAGVHDRAEIHADALVDRLRAQHARRAHLVHHLSCLVEHERQYILVVAHRDDALQHQLSVPRHRRAARPVVGVLPADAAVLLVNTHAVGQVHRLAFVIGDDGGEVLDVAQAVAAQLQVVGHGAGAGVAEVEGRFLVEWVAWVRVRDVHVGEGKAVEERSRVVRDVVQDHAFTLVVA